MNDDLALDGLAVYRLTRLVVSDTIFEEPRAAVLDRLNRGGSVARKIAEGLDCSWCVSVWVGFGWLAFRRATPRAYAVTRDALAFSAVAGLLSGHEYEPDEMTVDFHDPSSPGSTGRPGPGEF